MERSSVRAREACPDRHGFPWPGDSSQHRSVTGSRGEKELWAAESGSWPRSLPLTEVGVGLFQRVLGGLEKDHGAAAGDAGSAVLDREVQSSSCWRPKSREC